MCGIAGIINLAGVVSSDLRKMSDILKHRGPDDEGFVLIDPSTGSKIFARGGDSIPEMMNLPMISQVEAPSEYTVGIIHRRLSIIDLSANGHQPMSYLDGRYLIALNGEIYNYLEIKSELISKGYHFNSTSDTEVVVAAYDYWKNDCCSHFIGMWAFVIYDTENRNLFLSRDRFGIKPLYFSLKDNHFAFASEIKALLELEFVSSTAKISSVVEYIFYGSPVDSQDCLFKDVNQLSAGANLYIDATTLVYQAVDYYDLKTAVENYKDIPVEGKLVEKYREMFSESIRLHLRSDVPVGSCLSGGLDSSSIVAFASPLMKDAEFKTFTASYPGAKVDETHFAKMVSSAFGNINAFYTEPDVTKFWDEISDLIWHQDMPVGSTSVYAQWEVMKLAHQNNIKVLLDGQGSDEVLGGYYVFAGIYLLEDLLRFRFADLFRERKLLQQNFSRHINTDTVRAMYNFLPDKLKKIARKMNRSGINYISPEFHSVLNKVGVPAQAGKTYREMSYSNVIYTLQTLLRYEDRNSMAFSLESRVPFLDHRLVEYSIALENGAKLKNGFTKYILRKSSEPFLPAEITWRKDKLGFVTPQKDWRSQFGKVLEDYFENYKFPDFLNGDYIVSICNKEIKGETPVSEFWKMISLLKWIEVFNIKID